MNWRLVFQLSLFGLAMGIGTVYVIPSNIEPVFWLVVILISAYLIGARAGGHYFLHGLMVGLVNSVWVTGAHVLLFATYVANHPQEMAMMSAWPMHDHPRRLMALVGPCIGVVSGVVIGLLAWGASKLVRRPAAAVPR